MRKISPSAGYDELDRARDGEVIPALSRREAQALRERHPTLSPWVVLAGQAAAGLAVAIGAWVITGLANVGWSALYGAAAVVLPGAMFARGLMSKVTLINPAAAVTGFFLWEMMKIGLVLAMLFVSPKLVQDLNWPAMLAGLVVTMKAVWVVLWLDAKVQRRSKQQSKKLSAS